MIWFLLVFCSIAGAVLLGWAVVKADTIVRLIVVFLAVVIVAFAGHGIGRSWERLMNYDQYIYPFSEYSKHLRGLAERQELDELTNSVVLFDKRFNPSHDPRELQDAVLQIRKLGPYFEDTDETLERPSTNSP